MTKSNIIIIILVLAVLGFGAYKYAFRAPSAPSEDINASLSETSDVLSTYRISQEGTKATFKIGEVLRGSPFTAVGVTDQVAGEVVLDMKNPAMSKVSLIRVNARTLKTDSTNRDGAIARFILKSEDPANEFIEFKTSNLSGMPAEIKQGVKFNFEVAGDLKISGVTKQSVWKGEATPGADGKLTGLLSTKVLRSDYGLTISNVSFVASVEDAVVLELAFTAVAL